MREMINMRALKLSYLKMRIAVASDLHLEFHRKVLKLPQGDVAILAGDLGYPTDPLYREQLITIKEDFEAVFIVAGNHEYYCGLDMEEVNRQIEAICQEIGVYFLNRNSIEYKGYTFMGCTFWSNIPEEKMTQSRGYLKDFRKIKDMTPESYNELHQADLEWLQQEIVGKTNVIIVTHHLPTSTLIHEQYKGHPWSCCFVHELDSMIQSPILLWVCGHTHTHMQSEVNGVHCVVNPRGYPREKSCYDENYIFTLNE